MEVILQEDLPPIGKAGEIVRVKDGFARNFLIPRKKAVAADSGNRLQLEHQRRQALAREAKLRSAAEALGRQLTACRLEFARAAGPEGKLFGSVTVLDLVDAFKAKGFAVDRHQIILPAPLRTVGEQAVGVRLHAEITAAVPVVITPQG